MLTGMTHMSRTVTCYAKRQYASANESPDVELEDMSKHTPGPWVISVDARYPAEPCVDAVVDDVVWHVALCHNGPGPEDASAEANARLIAAAPELLAALKDALPLLRANLQKLTDISSQPRSETAGAFRAAKTRHDAAVALIEKVESAELPGDQTPAARARKPKAKD